MSPGLLIVGAEVDGSTGRDVRMEGGRIVAVGSRLRARRDDEAVDARGGAVIPGLHDHHVHLMSLAAAAQSVQCGPPVVRDRDDFAQALRVTAEKRSSAEWIRGVGYHESVAGWLDRHALDAFVSERPVRIQHRSGAVWFLNSTALERVDLDGEGRLFGRDRWLRERLAEEPPPDLALLGPRLATFGVTGVTDATATNGPGELALIRAAALPQLVVMMGDEHLPRVRKGAVRTGPLKVVLDESDLPGLDELAGRARTAHGRGRAVAVHCVTLTTLLLALTAFEAAGTRRGDRIEHASVAPPEAVAQMRRLRLTVVTQPNFVAERGDDYLVDVEAGDRAWLYRVRGLLAAGVPVGGGTDAPFGDPDPWRAMRAAVARRTAAGAVLGPEERVGPEQALALFTTAAARPGGRPRRVAVGEPADLCLLSASWREARTQLSSDLVRAVVRDGRVIYAAGL